MIPCGIVFRSVGYHGVPLPGVPFDARDGTIPNDAGRVLDEGGATCYRRVLHGVDQARAERGHRDEQEGRDRDGRAAPRGRASRASRQSGRRSPSLDAVLRARGEEIVTYAGWEAIDAIERANGEPLGRPRVKLCTWGGLLDAARR